MLLLLFQQLTQCCCCCCCCCANSCNSWPSVLMLLLCQQLTQCVVIVVVTADLGLLLTADPVCCCANSWTRVLLLCQQPTKWMACRCRRTMGSRFEPSSPGWQAQGVSNILVSIRVARFCTFLNLCICRLFVTPLGTLGGNFKKNLILVQKARRAAVLNC